MAKLFEDMPNIFRERYLNTHEKYLKSIADIIWYKYYGNKDWELSIKKTQYEILLRKYG